VLAFGAVAEDDGRGDFPPRAYAHDHGRMQSTEHDYEWRVPPHSMFHRNIEWLPEVAGKNRLITFSDYYISAH